MAETVKEAGVGTVSPAARAERLARRIGAALMSRSAARPLELVVVVVLLGLLGLAAYGDHVRNAGFVTDDWALRETWLVRTDGGDFGQLWNFVDGLFYARPALGIYLGVVQQVLGFHQAMHLALALATAILLSASFYLLLRMMRFAPLHAGIIAALTLIFPAADSMRLWAIMGDGSWALALLVLGAVLTLRSFEARGRRAWLLRAGALTLYALSLLTYEIGIIALGASVLLYRCRAPWRNAAVAWAQDVVVAVLVYMLATRTAEVERLSLRDTIDHALDIARNASALVGTQVLPLGVPEGVALSLAVLVIATAAVVAWRLDDHDTARQEIRRWLIAIGLSSVMTVAAYAVYASGWRGYDPLAPGLENRVNALAALPLATIAYGLGALIVLVVSRWLPPRQRAWVAAAPALLGLLLAASYFSTTRDHAATWTAGYRRAQGVLNLMSERMPKPPPGSMVLAFGQSAFESPHIPVWAARWDLDSAVALRYNDLTLAALPAFQGTRVVCGQHSMGPSNPGFPVYLPTDSRPYGKLYLFSVDGRWAAPRNRAQCQRVAPSFVPGPFFTPPGS